MKRFETISLRFAKEKPISSGVNSGSGDPPVRIIPEIIMKPSPEWRAVAASCWGSPQWAPARWDMWGSWDRLGRGRVQICCKGAPGRDRPRMKARNINDPPPALWLDPGLCNRFGQPAPPRAPGGTASSRTATATGAPTREHVTQPARSPGNPRARTSSRRARGLSDVLAGPGRSSGRPWRSPSDSRPSLPGHAPVPDRPRRPTRPTMLVLHHDEPQRETATARRPREKGSIIIPESRLNSVNRPVWN